MVDQNVGSRISDTVIRCPLSGIQCLCGHSVIRYPESGIRYPLSERGQVTVEVAVMWVAIVAAFVAMVAFLQQAIQGSLFGAAQSTGIQFDPQASYDETQAMTELNDVVSLQTGFSLVDASLHPAIEPVLTEEEKKLDQEVQDRKKYWILSDLPSGPVPREPAWPYTTYVQYEVERETSSHYERKR